MYVNKAMRSERTHEMELTDDGLLRRMIAGDEEAFTLLYRRKHPAIYRFALHMSGNAAVADDVTQEVFMTLIRDTARFDPAKGTLGGFLFGIARNHLRKRWEQDRRLVALLEGSEDFPYRESGDGSYHGGTFGRRTETATAAERKWQRRVSPSGRPICDARDCRPRATCDFDAAGELPRGGGALRTRRDELRRSGLGADLPGRDGALAIAPRPGAAAGETARGSASGPRVGGGQSERAKRRCL